MNDKWYEIPTDSEKEYIRRLNLKFFPLSEQKHRDVLKKWFDLSINSYDEITFVQAYGVAQEHQVEIKDVLKVFGNQVVNVDDARRPKRFRLVRVYKMLFVGNFNSIRVAKEYYEKIREFKRIELARNLPYTNAEYTAKELTAGLMKNDEPYEDIHLPLMDVGLLSIGGHPVEPITGYEDKYTIYIDVLDTFGEWYEKFLPQFGYLPGVNKLIVEHEQYDTNEIGELILDEDNKLNTLHPEIYKRCHELYAKKIYAEAVEKSFKVVRDRLRELTGYETGAKAFGIGKLHVNGATAENVERDFNEAVKFLTMSIDNFRNEKSHTADSKIEDPNRAYEYLCLSSLAMRLLEDTNIQE